MKATLQCEMQDYFRYNGKLLLKLSKDFNKKILILLSCDYCAVLIIHRYRKLPVFSQYASFIVFCIAQAALQPNKLMPKTCFPIISSYI